MATFPHGHPEPLFIPKLQSRFADFPWPRYLLTKGFLPRRPDAVISTVLADVRSNFLSRQISSHSTRELPRCILACARTSGAKALL